MQEVLLLEEDYSEEVFTDVVAILDEYFPDGLGDSPTEKAKSDEKTRIIYRSGELSLQTVR